MVSMGEMFRNVAHQWRQPLSAISVAASGIEIKRIKNVNDEELVILLDI